MARTQRIRFGGVLTACALAVMTLLLSAAISQHALSQSAPPLAFTDSSTLTLSSEPSRVQLVNNTAVAWALTTAAYLDVVDGVVETRKLDITDPPSSIAAGSSIVLVVPPAPDGVSKATGFLVITGS